MQSSKLKIICHKKEDISKENAFGVTFKFWWFLRTMDMFHFFTWLLNNYCFYENNKKKMLISNKSNAIW